MLSCVIKFEIFESILFTHLKFVFKSMLYNDDGFFINIKYNDHLQFYASAHSFYIFELWIIGLIIDNLFQ
jgi:hypothetical protein